MNNEEKFKNSLKELLNEPYYIYDASNWDKASLHLDEEDTRRKRRFLFILFTGLGLGVLISSYFLLLPKNKVAETSQVQKSAVSTNSIKDEPLTGLSKERKLHNNNSPERTEMAKPTPENNPKQIKTPVSPKTIVAVAHPEISSAVPVNHPFQANSKPGTADITLSNTTKPARDDNKDKQIPVSPEIKDEPAQNEALKKEPDVPETPLKIGAATTNTSDETTKQAPPGEILSAAAEPEKKKEEISEPLSITKKDTSAKPLALLPVPDSLVKPVSQPTLQSLPKTNFCYAEAGAYFNIGWKYQNTWEGRSLNPYLGLSYMMWLSDKAGFSAGVYYTTISQFKQSKEIRASKIVFGEESEVTTITPVRLNYISVPLKLQYALGSKQMLSLGYTAGYLLDVQSKVEKYTERLDQKENATTYKTGGYVEGFKTFNSQLSLGYRRLLKGNLWINGEVFLGLTDLRDNTFFGVKLNERANGLKISLTYDLIKK